MVWDEPGVRPGIQEFYYSEPHIYIPSVGDFQVKSLKSASADIRGKVFRGAPLVHHPSLLPRQPGAASGNSARTGATVLFVL